MKAILMPHPVLYPDGADYREGSRFDMALAGSPQHTSDGKIRVSLKFTLESEFMRRLLNESKAKVMVVVKCAKTRERDSVDVYNPNHTLYLSLDRYAEKIRLSPYIVSTEAIERFRSDEHHDEFAGVDIALPAGAILARGSDAELEIDAMQTLSAAIRLVTNNALEPGEYDVGVEEDHIKISMDSATRREVEKIRKTGVGRLYPSVYMAALTHAIQNVTPDGTRKWEESLRKTLKNEKIRIDDDLKTTAYRHAQRLLKYPVRYIADAGGARDG